MIELTITTNLLFKAICNFTKISWNFLNYHRIFCYMVFERMLELFSLLFSKMQIFTVSKYKHPRIYPISTPTSQLKWQMLLDKKALFSQTLETCRNGLLIHLLMFSSPKWFANLLHLNGLGWLNQLDLEVRRYTMIERKLLGQLIGPIVLHLPY